MNLKITLHKMNIIINNHLEIKLKEKDLISFKEKTGRNPKDYFLQVILDEKGETQSGVIEWLKTLNINYFNNNK